MINETINNITLSFHTETSVFSPSGIDLGTKTMLSFVTLSKDDKVLDLGCGYGTVGIWAAKQIGSEHVTMCDIDETSLNCARKNAIENKVADNLDILYSNGLEQITEHNYTLILSNPPYHTDFSVPKHFIEQGYSHLALGGKMVMVVKRKDWYANKLTAVFGGVTVHHKNDYYVLIAEKRAKKPKTPKEKPIMSKKLQRKYNRTLANK